MMKSIWREWFMKSQLGIVAGDYGVLRDFEPTDSEQGMERCWLSAHHRDSASYGAKTWLFQSPSGSVVRRVALYKSRSARGGAVAALDHDLQSQDEAGQLFSAASQVFCKDYPADGSRGKKEYAALRRYLVDVAVGGAGRVKPTHPVSVLFISVTVVLCLAMLTSAPGRNRAMGVDARPMGPMGLANPPGLAQGQGLTPEAAAALMAAGNGGNVGKAGLPDEARPRVSDTQMAKIKDLGERNGFVKWGGPNDKPFYVFSDPNCPSCKKLELNLAQPIDGFRQIVIPVAYKEGSDKLVNSLLCLPAKDRQAQWSPMVVAGKLLSRECAEGQRAMDENRQIFESMGFDSTPTLVSANRSHIAGAGSAEQVKFWLQNF